MVGSIKHLFEFQDVDTIEPALIDVIYNTQEFENTGATAMPLLEPQLVRTEDTMIDWLGRV